MSNVDSAATPSLKQVFVALFLVYITWGSSYIGYKLTLEVVGPFLAAGGRSFFGGGLLCLLLALTGHWTRPTKRTLRQIAVLAVPMVLVGSGFIGLGQTQVSSCIAAVMMGATPIIMIVAGFFFAHEPAPSRIQCLGMAAGSAAIVWLGLMQEGAAGPYPELGAFIVLLGSCGWVAGSLLARHHPLEQSIPTLQCTALVLVLGGLECFLVALCFGEPWHTHWENLRWGVVVAFSWMTIGGSLIAYSVYMWLLAHVALSVAVSYEYVVPVVGIFLGWSIGGEPVGLGTIVASAVTVGSVVLVIVPRTAGAQPMGHRGRLARWRLARRMHEEVRRAKAGHGSGLRH